MVYAQAGTWYYFHNVSRAPVFWAYTRRTTSAAPAENAGSERKVAAGLPVRYDVKLAWQKQQAFRFAF